MSNKVNHVFFQNISVGALQGIIIRSTTSRKIRFSEIFPLFCYTPYILRGFFQDNFFVNEGISAKFREDLEKMVLHTS